ncbi:hypothetical protein SNE40_001053 [Patella caerulea]|uniref:Polypeptide N-acetylgalactosaminyltransferase n=1 Tax=Patella caerulea TaxID=87958 RepID=A0AAN8Q324_PATCE
MSGLRLRHVVYIWIMFVAAFFILESSFIRVLPLENQDANFKDEKLFNRSVFEKHVVSSELTNNFNRTELRELLHRILERHAQLNTNFSKYNFNVTASNGISLDREIPDFRRDKCKTLFYNITEPVSVSVVIIFHNDALTMILRTVHSIINRSPKSMLKEIILVDDFSYYPDLGVDLDKYVSKLSPLVRVIRNDKREGLVRSRLHGANNSSGNILIFLDAHMECGHGWLEPIVYELLQNKASVVQPHVDQISGDDMKYFTQDVDYDVKGGITWDLSFVWYRIPKHVKQAMPSPESPYPTPILVGCAIAVWKENFNAIGQFDSSLNIWGGEHIELSFRTWLCGGRIVTLPCSHVGHLFKRFAYNFGGDRNTIIMKNIQRVANLWLGEYLWIHKSMWNIYHEQLRNTEAEIKSLAERREFLRKLKCKRFDWFLEAVLPELPIPSKDTVLFGEIFPASDTNVCLSVLDNDVIGIKLGCSFVGTYPQNTFSLDKFNKLVHYNRCVSVNASSQALKVENCYLVGNITWAYLEERQQLSVTSEMGLTKCATLITFNGNERHLKMQQCTSNDDSQKWRFRYNRLSLIPRTL